MVTKIRSVPDQNLYRIDEKSMKFSLFVGLLVSLYDIILVVFATGRVIYSRNCLGEIIFRIFDVQQFFAVCSEEPSSAEYLF